LQEKSVALQGLVTLEFVLFGTGSEVLAGGAPQSFRCRYAHAIAGAIRNVAQQSAAEWRSPNGIAQRLIAPGLADPDYRSVREVLEEFVGALSHGLEGIRDTQLLPFLGREDEKPRPRSAPLWRSNSTVVLITEGMKGITTFVEKTGIALAAPEQGKFIHDAIAFETRNIARARDAITGSVEEALADPHQLQGYEYLVVLTQSLQALIGEQLSAALGLSVGFSSLDGD
jgi:predicted lipoprotein